MIDAGGLVNGLTGFGTGLVTLPIWLLALAPTLASPWGVVCSVVAQLQTLPAIWHAVDGLMTAELARLELLALPGTLLGAWIGRRLYGRLDVARSHRIVLSVPLLAGVSMIAAGWRSATLPA